MARQRHSRGDPRLARRPRPLRSLTAHLRITGLIVRDTFCKACVTHGILASTLTDNGMVFTTRLAGGKGGRNAFETELHRLGVTQINSAPNHPTTCGKVCEDLSPMLHRIGLTPAKV